MHWERKKEKVKKLQKSANNTYALKSTNGIYRMIESNPGSMKCPKKLNGASTIKQHHQDASSATSSQASESPFGSKQSSCRDISQA